MKLLTRIGIGLLVLVLILVLIVALRPAEFRIERSTIVNAPPAAVQAEVVDFHEWGKWSPWEKLDPNMKKTHTGPASGVGASYAWTGNDQVGEGRMTITGASAERVDIRLEFLKPFAATNMTTFSFAPSGPGTRVTWAMTGRNDFMGKAFGLFMDMDKMVGNDFEKGLASLKQVAEH